jgi:cell division protein FtsN
MGRRDYKNARRPQAESPPSKVRKGGGLGTGLVIGLVAGMGIAGGMYWYLNSQPSGLKPVELPLEIKAPASAEKPLPKVAKETPAPIEAPPPEAPAKPVAEPAKAKAPPPEKKADARKPPPADYSFYDILPGKASPKPVKPAKPKVQHWLQVAALKLPQDAERLKARLILLGLPVVMQKVESGETTLYRVRVGPFKTEDDGLGALDTLAENDFEPRWVKDPVTP